MRRSTPTLWFVVPAHGRVELSAICLRQLRRTCDVLVEHGIAASAVVIAEDENLRTASRLGFGFIRHSNRFLSRKFNAGIQLACDESLNPRPADYVVPCGSDDWVDPALFLNGLPDPQTILAFRHAAFVDETGTQIVSRAIDYEGGVGIRVYPRSMMGRRRKVGIDAGRGEVVYAPPYRPADEDRERACDTSILVNIKRTFAGGRGPFIRYGDLHGWQIVDWKSADQQLNAYGDIVARFPRGAAADDPFETLRTVFPTEALDEMRAHYRSRVPVPA